MKREKRSGSHVIRGSDRKRRRNYSDTSTGEIPKTRVLPHLDKKYIFIICAALAAVLVIALSAFFISADNSDYKEYMTMAAEAYGSSDYDSALSFLRKAAAIEKTDECVLLMADCYEAQGNLDKTIEALHKLEDPGRSITRRIAELEKKRSAISEAEKLVVGRVKLNPNEKDLKLEAMGLENDDIEELRKLKSLMKLSLADNEISDISAISELTGLVSLNLSGNRLEDISSVKNLRGLKALYLDFNPIRELTPVLELKNLSLLSVKGLKLTDEQLEKLSSALPGCAIYSGSSDDASALISLGGVSFSTDVEDLNLSGRNITDISVLSSCSRLVRLNLSGNSISDLCPLMNIPGLKYLDISGNLIGDLRPLMGISSLETVLAADNRVGSTASLGNMTGLLELDISGNPIGDFSGIQKLKSLRSLKINNTGLTDESLEYLMDHPSLNAISMEDNPDISGEAVDALQRSLGSCLIMHSPLVYSVDFSGTLIKGNATELNLSSMNISDISAMSRLSFLKSVDLSKNNISNIYIFQYTESRDDIKYLDLSYNQIEDITPIASLINLETLDISGNKVNSVLPLLGLKNLKVLNIGGNALTGEQLKTLRDTLVNCDIISE